MKNLLSIRMRASKIVGSKQKALSSQKELHISGAEGLYEASDINRVVKRYIERALNHSKGKADKIIITIENIKQKPKMISALPVTTVNCQTPDEGKKIIIKLLQLLGISKEAIDVAVELIKRGNMRGASIITAKKGNRLEPDKDRGVRVSRLGIDKKALKLFSSRLSRHGINTDTVKEALTLASKVISHKDIIAELCISDDPDYTTGYVASQKYGYVRIPKIKYGGNKIGGRAFFVKEGIHIEELINYLERKPIIIKKVSPCKGIFSINEVVCSPYK